MRLPAMLLASLAVLVWSEAADAQDRRGKGRREATYSNGRGYSERPSTVDHRGLCQRDTGRPAGSLNLNERCDREEFWARFNDLGGNGRSR